MALKKTFKKKTGVSFKLFKKPDFFFTSFANEKEADDQIKLFNCFFTNLQNFRPRVFVASS